MAQTQQQYKCPCCGGSIEFDVGAQKMKCPYCDTEFDVEAFKEYDSSNQEESVEDISWDTADGAEWSEAEGMYTYVCKSCGGQIICDENTAATSCPYCGSPVILSGRLAGELRPDYVIPFKLGKEAAVAGLKKHISGLRLLPKVFKDENHIDEIRGIYVPFWLFDADADVDVHYKGTKVRAWSDSNYNYVETSYYAVRRGGSIGFNHIPVDGSSKLDDDLMQSIEPYDFSAAVDFNTAYLSGYLADKYDVDAAQSSQKANSRIRVSSEAAFGSTAQDYASKIVEACNIRLFNGKVKYALYPVWILNTSWKGNNYIFAMNGQTGKFVGDLPVDKKARNLWFAGLTALIGAAAYGIIWLLTMFG